MAGGRYVAPDGAVQTIEHIARTRGQRAVIGVPGG